MTGESAHSQSDATINESTAETVPGSVVRHSMPRLFGRGQDRSLHQLQDGGLASMARMRAIIDQCDCGVFDGGPDQQRVEQ